MVSYQNHRANMVRLKGLEPIRFAAPEPKGDVTSVKKI